MRDTILLRVAALSLLCMSPLSAQANPIHLHIAQVADGFPDTPGGEGLLPTAAAEAAIAAQHAELAVEARSNLGDVRLHIAHVLHAIDPTLVVGGPGLGYGVKQATAAAAVHIEMIATDTTASEVVRLHAGHISASLGNVLECADAIVSLAQQIDAAGSASSAGALIDQMSALASALLFGLDADGDGRVGWQHGEGGLRQAAQHMTLLKRGEGLIAAGR